MLNSPEAPSANDRLLAALAHFSVLLAWLGPLGPLAVWLADRGKSAYVRFHALQAMAYQVIGFWLLMLFGLLAPIVVLLANIPSLSAAAAATGVTGLTEILAERVLTGLTIGIGSPFLVYFLIGLIAGIVCLAGGEARYPWLGGRLQAYLERDARNEERWLASMAHGTAVWLLWGAIFPFVLWLARKDRSPLLRYHSLQAFIYQLGFGLFFVLLAAVSQVLLFIPVWLATFTEDMGVMLLVAFVVLALAIVLLLSHPLYQAIAIWAMVRAAQGREPRYPLLGRWLARRLSYAPGAE